MYPTFELFGRTIALYGLLTCCGIFVAGITACWMAVKRGLDYVDLIIYLLIISAGAFIGSRLLFGLVNYEKIISVSTNLHQITGFRHLLNIIGEIFGGGVFYGSLIGGFITGYIILRKHPEYRGYLDIIAVNIPLFHFFGRLGCFMGSCCWGIPSKYGFIYTRALLPEINGIRLFPVQLLEAFLNGCLFLFLLFLYKKDRLQNKLLYVYFSFYAIMRFFLEYLRGDTHRGIWGWLSTSQIISVIIIVLVLCKITIDFCKSQKKE